MELWKDIPGYEGRYQASSLGHIRSLDRYVACGSGGKGERLVRGRVLKPAGQKRDPHLRVVLGHKAHGTLVHRLVALAFLGPCPDGMEVLHGDGNPTNNRIDNLRYGTRTENILDVYRQGKKWRKHSEDDARRVKKLLAEGFPAKAVAQMTGVTINSVWAIKAGRIFKWVK